MPSRVKNIFLGNALHNEESRHQRLSNPIALAVFSSDALSSTRMRPARSFSILAVAGTANLYLTWPIALAIGVLLIIVVTSYRQTIKAYPQGGGSYRVASDNLGTNAGLVAGRVAARRLRTHRRRVRLGGYGCRDVGDSRCMPYRVEIALFFVAILAVANLRGVKESGGLFAVPTYGFITLMVVTIGTGFYLYLTGGVAAITVPAGEAIEATGALTIMLILQGLRVGLRGDDRRRGDRRRSRGVPGAHGEERPPSPSRGWRASCSSCSSGCRGSRCTRRCSPRTRRSSASSRGSSSEPACSTS